MQSSTSLHVEKPPPRPRHGRQSLSELLMQRRGRIAEGVGLGALIGITASQVGLMQLLPFDVLHDPVLVPALAGALIALSPARQLLHWAAGITLAAMLLVAYTPLMLVLLPPLKPSYPLQSAPAVVVLSSAPHKDGTLDEKGQERVLHGYILMRQGYSSHLVLTSSIPNIGDQTPAVRAQMRLLGFDFPTDDVGPVANTHDEAVAVSALARKRGWRSVILVTHPLHMRRARAVFEKTGLQVFCAPCATGAYDPRELSSPGKRLEVFREWAHETVGFASYRLHGWL